MNNLNESELARIIVAESGTGKTYFAKRERKIRVVDAIRNDIPFEEYISKIKQYRKKSDLILIKYETGICEELLNEGIEFAFIYRPKEGVEITHTEGITPVELPEGLYISDLFSQPKGIDILAQVTALAKEKGLEAFVFEGEELNKYLDDIPKGFGIATIAKDKDSAIWNLKNTRHCYILEPEIIEDETAGYESANELND